MALTPAQAITQLTNRLATCDTRTGQLQTLIDKCTAAIVGWQADMDAVNHARKHYAAQLNAVNELVGNPADPDPSIPAAPVLPS